LALAGVGLALPAIALVGAGSESAGHGQLTRRTLVRALGSGSGFGLYFVLLAETHKDAGVWPLIPGRLTGMTLLVLVALVSGRLSALPRPAWRLTAACGVCDSTANVLYILAVQRGLLSLVAVLTALYPASTVLLARVVLKERLGRKQLAGLAVALAAVTLVAAGS
jgi:drug/metabolite transporter (DMT)-like permease